MPSVQDRQSSPSTEDANWNEPRRVLGACPLCSGHRLHYAFSNEGDRVVRCADCRLMLLNPQRAAGAGTNDPVDRAAIALLKDLARYRSAVGGTLLEVGCGRGELLQAAERAGYRVTGVEACPEAAAAACSLLASGAVICGELQSTSLTEAAFDVVVLDNRIGLAPDPLALLRTVRRLLKPDGTLLLSAPSLDSWPARLLRRNWSAFARRHLTYFDSNTMQHALFHAGFHQAVVRPARRGLSLGAAAERMAGRSLPFVPRLLALASRWAPRWLRERILPLPLSGMIVLATPAPAAARRKLSVVVPAYNEAATLDTLLKALIRKELPGLDIEIIIVESNSTDGTRIIAAGYAAHPRVRLVLEDRPRGKGHAVRTGLQHATGDFILIQDADLEYDLEDYDVLLDPLIRGHEALILGSRHGGRAWWKMRQFARQPLLSLFFNCGHWIFTGLLNLLFRQRLRDPFTMFKVFRRDCLFGLEFHCDRFDFDYELLIKLVRKGYKPTEIPVNYRSRTYGQGKKVRAFRDPLTWLRALVQLRFERIDPMRAVEKSRVTLAAVEGQLERAAAA